ncbi:MAG: hypothetical protein AAGA20_02720 [Planctomycetota bacterium]
MKNLAENALEITKVAAPAAPAAPVALIAHWSLLGLAAPVADSEALPDLAAISLEAEAAHDSLPTGHEIEILAAAPPTR